MRPPGPSGLTMTLTMTLTILVRTLIAKGPSSADEAGEDKPKAASLPGFIDTPAGQPVLAVVGRPNVGKSTLVNRILGSRQAVVQDVPGVTRDRVAYDATWRGRTFTIVDTGGWDTRAQGLSAQVAEQAKVAVELADAVLFVVDARVGATDEDEAVARVLRRAGKPVILAANKVDDQKSEADAASLWSLGLGEPFAVSALHGRASGDLLDLVLEALPEAPPERIGVSGGPRRVALIGRPNVGKSSLLNRLAGENRALVSPVAGTTRDPVDEVIELGGKPWRFVDTAGIKRRFRESQGADYFAALRTSSALDRAEVAVVLIDASESLTDQDLRILTMVIDAGRALVIAYNKWDLTDEERRHYLGGEIERALYSARWAPRVNISAETGRSVDRSSSPPWRRRSRAGSGASPLASSTPGLPGSSRRLRRLCAAAACRRSSSPRRQVPGPRTSCCSPPGSWRRPTGGSSSGACARSSASRAPRSG